MHLLDSEKIKRRRLLAAFLFFIVTSGSSIFANPETLVVIAATNDFKQTFKMAKLYSEVYKNNPKIEVMVTFPPKTVPV